MSIKKNFIYNFTYQILLIIIPLLTTPYIARVVGPEGIGIQAYTYSIANYFVLFSMLGINNYGNRSIAMIRDNKEELDKTFSSIYMIQIAMASIMMIIYVIYIIFFAEKFKLFFIIQSIYILSSLLDINWFFFGMELFKLTVIRNCFIKILTVLSIFFFVKESSDIYIYTFILAIGSFISQIILWKFARNYVKLSKVAIKDIIVHVKPIIILFIPVISISIYKIMDKIMIGKFSNVIQVGFYENSEKIINIPLGLIVSLGTIMLPKMSNLQAKGNFEESRRYISLSIEFIMFMVFGAMFGLIAISPILIPMFLGNSFSECIKIVSLLSITMLFIAWANVIRTQYLIPNKKDGIYIVSTIIGAIINLIINLLLIKRFGALGAAIGTIFAEASVAIYQTIMVRNELKVYDYLKRAIFYIIPGSIMFIIVKIVAKILGESLVSGMIQIIIGGLIYLLLSAIYLLYSKNKLNIVNNIRAVFKKSM